MIKREEWKILGRTIGVASGWDQGDTFVIALYDFEPTDGIKLPSGTLTIDFESGTASTHDDAGNTLESVDLVQAIAASSLLEL